MTKWLCIGWVGCVNAVMFLTRVPAGRLLPTSQQARLAAPDSPALGCAYFSAVGALIGTIAASVYAALEAIGLPTMFCAVAALAASATITGALHEDGLADFFDGIGGGHTRERRLAIMRDSQIGTFGAMVLILSTAMRWSAIVAIAEAGSTWDVVIALVAAHAISRALLPPALLYGQPATPTGLAGSIAGPSAGEALFSSATALAIGFAAIPWPTALTAITIGMLIALFMLGLAKWLLGGHTGDVLGAIQQLGEIGVLAAIVCAL